MHLENDSFTVIYDSTDVSVAAMLEKIRGLGYKPRKVAEVKLTREAAPVTTEPLPELIATALADAVKENKLLLVDFHARWCAPCKVLEKKVFPDADVKHALESFRLLKVDTDRHPEVAEYFKIKALPTLLVLDKKATNHYRHMGLIDADELVRELANVSNPEQQEGAH